MTPRANSVSSGHVPLTCHLGRLVLHGLASCPGTRLLGPVAHSLVLCPLEQGWGLAGC